MKRDHSNNVEKIDVFTKITNRIIADLEKGVLPWRKPWSADHLVTALPLSGSTGEPYHGINAIMLWLAAADKGYKCRYWFTFDQAKKLGGNVKKGERSETAVYYKTVTKVEATEDTDAEYYRLARGYAVFNGDQCEGLPAKFYVEEPASIVTPKERHAASELFFANTGAEFRHGGNKAFYSPSQDFIQLPPFETFEDAESYAGTKGHEMIHWTKHETRLNRDYEKKKFGDENYAKEELVAELGAAFLCAILGITPETRDDHAQYIGHWLQVMKGDNHVIFSAASEAQKAIDFLQGLQVKQEKIAAAA
jgi:antirestriction protein ArdC